MPAIHRILPALILFLLSSAAQGAIIAGTGYIDTKRNIYTIDNVYFRVNSDSLVNMSVVAAEFSSLDTYINLYTDDGALTLDDFIDYSDDTGTPSDSYLSVNLNSGDYLLRISSYDFLESNLGDYNYDPGSWESAGAYGYEISGDVNLNRFVQGPELTAVPLPPSMLLLASGLFGLINIARSKHRI